MNLVLQLTNSLWAMVKVSKQVLLHGVLGVDGLYKFQSIPPLGSYQSAVSQTTTPIGSTINKFVYPISFISTCNTSKSCNVPVSCILWHLRLGHPHFEALKSVLQHCNVSSINKSDISFCSASCLGKAHRLPAQSSNTVYHSPFELIFTDLWGPAPILSFDGYSYHICFIDACTKYTWIYFLKKKSNAFTAFQNFYQYVLNQFSKSIKSI
ncbi:unnamed protein product [Cuscuta europaea]|uniref:GAG-pre-integrase domain-containing protein n=1 Tax=Cuscuta europaea TaxID=41803 RepID=A0A9P0ZGY6_CUSEU|nr:unnamed protein product [Cuscuta europaea]